MALKDTVEALKDTADKVAEDASPSKYLIGATTVVTSVFVALQITGNTFSRMLANHPVLVFLAMVCAFLATALAFVALILGTWFNKQILLAGVALVLAGTTFAVVAALLVSTDQGKPIVAITKLEERELEATVKVINVKTDETVRVRVEPLVVRREEGGLPRYAPPAAIRSIYEAAFGPDAEGNVEQTISVDLPGIEFTHVGVRAWVGDDGDVDCYSKASKTTGCVTREVVGQERPQLAASWDFAAKQPRLIIKVSGQSLRGSGYGYLRVRADGASAELASWAIATDATGSFERTLEVQIPPTVTTVCTEASMVELPAATCDAPNPNEMSWVRLTVPKPAAEKP